MKIAFVNTSRGWGGAEEQMLAMALELERRGNSISVVARRNGLVQQRFEHSGYHVLPVDRTGFSAVIAPFAAAIRAVKERFDIIHCHRDHDLLLGALLAKPRRIPLLLTQHCLPGKPNLFVYGLADQIITVSAYIASGIRAKLPAIGPRLGVIVNGIDLHMFSDPDRNFWGRHSLIGFCRPLLGVVGAFYKGQDELIGMLPALRKIFPQLALILIGEDDSRKPALVELAERLGVAEAVVFFGRIPREQMKDALAGLDLNVSAFRNEGFGLTVIEGLAVGTPFVGYRAGGYPEIVTCDAAGVLVDDAPAFVEAVVRMLRDQIHPITSRLDNCASVAAEFTLSRMIDAYETLYGALKGRA
ncbi:MAG TPA: glycosyltransferase family 4 protein [Desulfuromonadales bacterium]|nr:glycosyltransferase family 4 protein [Desulfuromonadales bacterium]